MKASIIFVLFFALTVFIGVSYASPPDFIPPGHQYGGQGGSSDNSNKNTNTNKVYNTNKIHNSSYNSNRSNSVGVGLGVGVGQGGNSDSSSNSASNAAGGAGGASNASASAGSATSNAGGATINTTGDVYKEKRQAPGLGGLPGGECTGAGVSIVGPGAGIALSQVSKECEKRKAIELLIVFGDDEMAYKVLYSLTAVKDVLKAEKEAARPKEAFDWSDLED